MLEQPSSQPLRNEERERNTEALQLGKQREAYWDNVKAVCVLLVVCFHALMFGSGMTTEGKGTTPDMGSKFGEALLASLAGAVFTLSVIVMPGFTFVSGHLSSMKLTPRRVRNLLQMALAASIQQVITATLKLCSAQKDGEDILPFRFFGAMNVQWFLICLIFWRVSLPFWMMLRRPLLVSVLVGCLALFTDATNVNFHTFLSFLPFFIAGHLTPREKLQQFRGKAACVGFFAVVAIAAALPLVGQLVGAQSTAIDKQSLALIGRTYGCFYNEAEACEQWLALPMRLIYYLIAVPLIPAFLAVVPARPVWFLTRAGAFSMYIYLLHIWFLMPYHMIGEGLHGGIYVLSTFLYAFAVWAFLGTGIVRPVCKWFIEPRIDCLVQSWVLEDDPVGSSRATQEALSSIQEPVIVAEV